jgi:hypothetical protein
MPSGGAARGWLLPPNVPPLEIEVTDGIRARTRKPLWSQQFVGAVGACGTPQKEAGGEGGIRTHVPELPDHPISSRRRYDHFGTSPAVPGRGLVF